MSESPPTTTCYRHPGNIAGVSCQRCGRRICAACMHQASVGFHCPECLKQGKQKVVTARSLDTNPVVTFGLIAVNVAVYVFTTRTVTTDFGLYGPSIDVNSEWWRIVTSGFLHADLIHVGFNMYLLYMLGRQLEKVLGPVDFGLLYAAGLAGGSALALLASPNALTVGASGAVFGLMGGWVMFTRSRGISFTNSGIAGLLALNLVFSFRSGVSWGGHIGGLLAGLLVGWLLTDAKRFIADDRARRLLAAGVSVVAFTAAIAAASTWSSPLLG